MHGQCLKAIAAPVTASVVQANLPIAVSILHAGGFSPPAAPLLPYCRFSYVEVATASPQGWCQAIDAAIEYAAEIITIPDAGLAQDFLRAEYHQSTMLCEMVNCLLILNIVDEDNLSDQDVLIMTKDVGWAAGQAAAYLNRQRSLGLATDPIGVGQTLSLAGVSTPVM